MCRLLFWLFGSLITLVLTSCIGVPDGIEPVRDFDANRYLGKWYELARLDHSFERGLQQVSAEYSFRDDGGIRVVNRGYDTDSGIWDKAVGKAYFVQTPDIGHLKVSFFGPFFGSYIIFDLGNNYEYALVTSSDRSYLWLLSRTPELAPEIQQALLEKIEAAGFNSQELIFVNQSPLPPSRAASTTRTSRQADPESLPQ